MITVFDPKNGFLQDENGMLLEDKKNVVKR